MGFTKFDYITPVKFKPRVEGWNDIEKLKAYNVDEDFRFFPPNSKEAIRRSIAIRIRELELENGDCHFHNWASDYKSLDWLKK